LGSRGSATPCSPTLIVYTLLTFALILGSRQIFGNISRYLLPASPLLYEGTQQIR
jgi:hypothetical protein